MKDSFTYDPDTGILLYASGEEPTGMHVRCKGKMFPKTHIIWFLHHGELPPKGMFVDHKDRNRGNNKISNLRLATPSQNQCNRQSKGKYAKGVDYSARYSKPWRARISIDGIPIIIGRFETHDEAATAYQVLAIEAHGEFACYD